VCLRGKRIPLDEDDQVQLHREGQITDAILNVLYLILHHSKS
jgi:hypothetical protein